MADDLFMVWDRDEIDSSEFEDTDHPRPLYVAYLCRDTDGKADLVRGYSPRDGIFERPGVIVESLGGIDMPQSRRERQEYEREIEQELREQFEARRESMIVRGES